MQSNCHAHAPPTLALTSRRREFFLGTTKLPRDFDRTLFIYEWSRDWIIAVKLDKDSNLARDAAGKPMMERFCPKMTFKRPMDLELGPDGCLYLIEWGTAWGNNKDTQIVRIERVDVAR